MEQKLLTTTVAALALVAIYGTANAASPGVIRTTMAVSPPETGMDVADSREIIAPPSDIDPGMARMPPATGARMPIVTPPATPDR
jgi:hypothetical protein